MWFSCPSPEPRLEQVSALAVLVTVHVYKEVSPRMVKHYNLRRRKMFGYKRCIQATSKGACNGGPLVVSWQIIGTAVNGVDYQSVPATGTATVANKNSTVTVAYYSWCSVLKNDTHRLRISATEGVSRMTFSEGGL